MSVLRSEGIFQGQGNVVAVANPVVDAAAEIMVVVDAGLQSVQVEQVQANAECLGKRVEIKVFSMCLLQ